MPKLLLRALAVSVGLVLVPAHALAFKKERLVVLLDPGPAAAGVESAPVHGLSGGAADVIAAKGYEVLAGPKVDEFARAQVQGDLVRMTHLRASDLVKQYRADGLLIIRLTFFLPEEDRRIGPRANAAMGVSAERRGRDGRVTWRGTASAFADEAGALGSVDPQALVNLACERVLWSLPRAPPDPALVAIAEANKRKAAEQAAPTWRPRRPPDPQQAEALLKNEPKFRTTQPRFRLKVGRRPATLREPQPPPPAPEPPEGSFEGEKKRMRRSTPVREVEEVTPDERTELERRAREARAEALEAERLFRAQWEANARPATSEPSARLDLPPVRPPPPYQPPAPDATLEVDPGVLSTSISEDEHRRPTPPAAPLAPQSGESSRGKPSQAPRPAEGPVGHGEPSATRADEPQSDGDLALVALLRGPRGAWQLDEAMSRTEDDMRRCLRLQLEREPVTEASGLVLVTVDQAGRVTRLAVDSGKLRDSHFESCLREAASTSWRFPGTGAQYQLALPLDLLESHARR